MGNSFLPVILLYWSKNILVYQNSIVLISQYFVIFGVQVGLTHCVANTTLHVLSHKFSCSAYKKRAALRAAQALGAGAASTAALVRKTARSATFAKVAGQDWPRPLRGVRPLPIIGLHEPKSSRRLEIPKLHWNGNLNLLNHYRHK